MKTLKSIILILSLILSFNSAAADPKKQYVSVDLVALDKEFQNNQFDKLEKRAEQYRNTMERTKHGGFAIYFFYNYFYDIGYNEKDIDRNLRKLEAWAKKYPNSHTPILALTKMFDRISWQARGTKMAREVSEENMAKFMEMQRDINFLLTGLETMAVNDPIWYEMRLRVIRTISMSSAGTPTHREIIMLQSEKEKSDEIYRISDLAQKKFPEYFNIYVEGAKALSKNWGGSDQAVVDYVDYLTKDNSDLSNKLYSRIYAFNMECLCKENTDFVKKNVSWSKMYAGFDSLSNQFDTQFFNMNKAKFAMIYNHTNVAFELEPKIKNDMKNFFDTPKEYEYWLHYITQVKKYKSPELEDKKMLEK